MDYFSQDELENLLGSVGDHVKIDRTVQLFNAKKIFIGSNVRIDCFCILIAGSQGIHIGNHTHIAASAMIAGSNGKVIMEDFSGLSCRVVIYTASDDYTEGYMTNPTVEESFKNVKKGDVTLRKHVIIGAGTVILPGIELCYGAAVGALSLVHRNVDEMNVCFGSPIRRVSMRHERLRELEKEFLEHKQQELTHMQ